MQEFGGYLNTEIADPGRKGDSVPSARLSDDNFRHP